MFELKSASLKYGETTALWPYSRTFKRGRITVLIGANGAGKSTVMSLLTSEQTPTTGAVFFQNRNLTAWKVHELAQRRAVLPQRTHLSFPFTVYEVVGLGLMASTRPPYERKRLIGEMLARVDLADHRSRLYQQLSGGEQQRVQLARVLCQLEASDEPAEDRYLLLDEPITSLDIRHQISTMNIARGYAEQGLGVIAVLHDLNLAAHYADEVIVMREGRVLADCAPAYAFDPDIIEEAFGVRPQIIDRGNGLMPFVSVLGPGPTKTPRSQNPGSTGLVH
ncbi:MAG: heme ABC transporter ATP-binding protein [Pseudomonadota bacterium]